MLTFLSLTGTAQRILSRTDFLFYTNSEILAQDKSNFCNLRIFVVPDKEKRVAMIGSVRFFDRIPGEIHLVKVVSLIQKHNLSGNLPVLV